MSAEIIKSHSGGEFGKGNLFLVTGIIFLLLAYVGVYMGIASGDSRAILGWLVGYSFWISIALGSLFLVMLFYVFDAGWSVILRRQLEHGLATLKWLGLAFLPILVMVVVFSHSSGIGWLWLNPENTLSSGEAIGHDILYQSKSGFLNMKTFVVACLLFFSIWSFLAYKLRRNSFSMDVDGDHDWVYKSRFWSALGIILTGLSVTFAAIYWFKSLEYHWFSTMYGVWFFSACMRAALAAIIITCAILASRGPLKGLYNPAHTYYIACLSLAFTVFWAYISFSQYFLIYNANIPEETFWFNIREVGVDGLKNTWWWVSMALIFCHFLIPFVALLWYHNKFGLKIVIISAWILVFHLVDLYWNILPGKIEAESRLGYSIREMGLHWVDFSALIGVGGICIWAFLKSLNKEKIIPVRDPRIMEAVHHHE